MGEMAVPIGFSTENCCDCGIIFMVPTELQKRRRADGKSFYCPNGHPLVYSDESAAKLQERLDRAEESLEAMRSTLHDVRGQRDAAENSRNGYKGLAARRQKALNEAKRPK